MPDPVHCSVDSSSHIITCEVDITAEPSDSAAQSQAVASPPDPGVSALVNRFLPPSHEVHAPPVDMITADTPATCAGKISGVAIALLSTKQPLLSVLGGLKAGLDLSECVVKDANARQTSADQAAAVKECADHAGTPYGWADNTLTCAVDRGPTP